jgi:hypothetical protein
MSLAEDLSRLQKSIEASRAEASRKEGELRGVMTRLAKDFILIGDNRGMQRITRQILSALADRDKGSGVPMRDIMISVSGTKREIRAIIHELIVRALVTSGTTMYFSLTAAGRTAIETERGAGTNAATE